MIERNFIEINVLPGGELPVRAHDTDAAFDCFARWVEVRDDVVVCLLGFRLALAPGWFADLRPRSSIFKTGLSMSNSCGVIDSGYRGEVAAMFYRVHSGADYVIGDRVAQIMFRRLDPVRLLEVSEIGETPRGAGGFGSTGT